MWINQWCLPSLRPWCELRVVTSENATQNRKWRARWRVLAETGEFWLMECSKSISRIFAETAAPVQPRAEFGKLTPYPPRSRLVLIV